METILLIHLLSSIRFVVCRDFYIGMFKRNDYLVAQDNLYRERRPYAIVQAEYGRLFKCPITYFRVVDRLGVGSGPSVKVVRGGLRQKYIAVRVRSVYGLPVSVNIYVGCENPTQRTPKRPWKEITTAAAENKTSGDIDSANTTPDSTNNKTDHGALDNKDGDATKAADGGGDGGEKKDEANPEETPEPPA